MNLSRTVEFVADSQRSKTDSCQLSKSSHTSGRPPIGLPEIHPNSSFFCHREIPFQNHPLKEGSRSSEALTATKNFKEAYVEFFRDRVEEKHLRYCNQDEFRII